jgi:flagellar motor component MotA
MKNKLNFKLDLRKLEKNTQNTDWQRGLFISIVMIFIVFFFACAYLLIKPIPEEIKSRIDEEISSVDILFNEKTLEEIRSRQNPVQTESVSTGKNPFTSF